MAVRYGFRARDGDEPDDLDVDELLELIADDYLRTGDLEEAMDRLLDDGYVTESRRARRGAARPHGAAALAPART